MNTTTRFPLLIISPRVGHSSKGTGREGGTNAIDAIPEDSKTGAQTSVRDRDSGLVKSRVTISVGLAARKVATLSR